MTHAKRGRRVGNTIGPDGRKLPRTAPGKLSPTGKTGPAGNHEATQQATAAKRSAMAMDLYVYHRWSMQQIADALTKQGLACTAKTVCLDIHKAVDAANEAKLRTVAHGQALEARRLDQSDRQLLPIAIGDVLPDVVTVTSGSGKKRRSRRVQVPIKSEPLTRLRLDALAQLRRNGESRRKLFGWDATPDEGFIRLDQVVAMVRGLVEDILELTADNAELRRQVAGVMRRRFGLMEAQVVDAEPTT